MHTNPVQYKHTTPQVMFRDWDKYNVLTLNYKYIYYLMIKYKYLEQFSILSNLYKNAFVKLYKFQSINLFWDTHALIMFLTN